MSRWSYWLLNFLQFQCIILGFTIVTIDFKRRQLKHYKSTKYYVIIMNFISLFLIINSIYWNFFVKYKTNENIVIILSQQSVICVRIILTVMVIIMRSKRDIIMRKFLQNIFYLQNTYFDHLRDNVKINNDLEKVWLTQIGILVPHIINLFLYLWNLLPLSDLSMHIEIYYICSQINMTHFILLQHSAILCYIHKCLLLLNYQLDQQEEISNLAYIYDRLCSMLRKLNLVYSPILICIQIHFLLALSIVVLSIGESLLFPHKYPSTILIYLNLIFYILLCIHMFAYLIICDRMQQISGSMQTILLLYNEKTCNEEVNIFINLQMN